MVYLGPEMVKEEKIWVKYLKNMQKCFEGCNKTIKMGIF
jgi:hypothetical protein